MGSTFYMIHGHEEGPETNGDVAEWRGDGT